MKKISLTQGHFALVDDDDYHALIKFKWQFLPSHESQKTVGYAVMSIRFRDEVIIECLMHRMIMHAGNGDEIDHKNGCGLDNQKLNLRFASRSQQMANMQIRRDNRSGYKGVCPENSKSSWRATIVVNKRTYNLGTYPSKEDAAYAYNEAAKKFYGDFAVLNKLPKNFIGIPANRLEVCCCGLCRACTRRDYMREYSRKNRHKINAAKRERRKERLRTL